MLAHQTSVLGTLRPLLVASLGAALACADPRVNGEGAPFQPDVPPATAEPTSGASPGSGPVPDVSPSAPPPTSDGADAGTANGSSAGPGSSPGRTDDGAGDASADAGPCTASVLGPPAATPYAFTVDGQKAWSHDDGFAAGYFHTYDALASAGNESAPHKVHVFLPRGYGACDRGYPVVYMNDGDTAFWPGGLGHKSWNVAQALDTLYRERAIPTVIVVAIEPKDREYEYSYARYSKNGSCCGADAYTRYVAEGVKGFVDAHYRTRRDPSSTAIVGSSRGGLASFYMATRRPDVFGRAGSLSPSFWAGLDPIYGGDLPGGSLAASGLVAPVASLLADTARRPRLWIDWGLVRIGGFHNETIEAAATTRGREMVGLLTGTYGYVNGRDLAWEEDPNGEHDETSWARRLPRVLRSLFAP